ncbi:ADP-ribose pyrophosphatase [Deinococcus sp. Marseille-Q6407]|uniref:ADP-ribose pyrophosphatase n=1 Tax=Deinococcus sp. Marseille-Q6407 TaxID=2969223 RepID=UPI0021C0966E|nr:ADP-ribose pyrophosphatase [Deinococcus sp. Marseille-Q6407]
MRLTGIVGIYTLQGGGWPDIYAYVFHGECESPGAVAAPDPDEVAEVLWLLPTDLAQRQPLLPDVAAALEDVLTGHYGAVRAVQRKVQLPPLDRE